ncbi:kinase-like protein [Artomyces pyxidatus]|uniref:Kinase-like protein n=1 Tax=Artomyces pyxidatus TaxID=48021 RepID=A0ACB8SM79_9AGAM|nr:kinase-like protein [Artomyces pyxidatus]
MEYVRVGGRYRLDEKIGAGTFGDVYLAFDIIRKEHVAVKLEPLDTDEPSLEHEYSVYEDLSGTEIAPRIRWFGCESGHDILVMDLHGLSLDELLKRCGGRFSLKTVLSLAEQMLHLLESLHAQDYVHCDIKPANFLLGTRKSPSQLYIADMGLARRYRDPVTRSHIVCEDNLPPIGTARYASIRSHQGFRQSRRDDLESVAYVLINLLRGSLPWQHSKVDSQIVAKKTTFLAQLRTKIPNEFSVYINYTWSLRYDEDPDYEYLRNLFQDLFIREGYKPEPIYDWEVEEAVNDTDVALLYFNLVNMFCVRVHSL